MGELLPCPFCGKADAFVEQSTFASSYVICNDCSARGPDSCQDSDDEDEPGHAAAIAAWNTRIASSPPAASVGVDEIKRLRKALEDVCNPLGYLRRLVEADGCKLGGMAYAIANDLATVKGIARAALASSQEEEGE